MNTMIVHYRNGEQSKFEVGFEAHDLESISVPIFGGLVIEVSDTKQVVIMLEQVQEIEFIINED